MLDSKRLLYLVVYYFTRFYFATIHILFSLTNWFRRSSKGPLRTVEDPLLLKPAVELANDIRSGKVGSEELVQSCIKRCEYVNPLLNCIVRDRYKQALAEARIVDQQIAEGTAPSEQDAPFLGVPFTLKDCIFVEGLLCTAGIVSRANGEPETKDAEAVRLMRKAGAIVLAITNVSEVCMWWESNNGIYGRTRNPYDHRRIVGGSSGGEGCLLASAGSVIGIGSDIGGSIRMPAFFNGIFGHKATRLLVSDEGCYPDVQGFQKYMHTPGPMCRFATDLLPMLRVLAGENSTKISDEKLDFKQLRIFYMEDIVHPEVGPLHVDLKRCLRKAVKYLEDTHGIEAVRLDLPLVHQIVGIWLNDMNEPDAPSFAEEMLNRVGVVNPYKHTIFHLLGKTPHTAAALGLALYEDIFKRMVTPGKQHFLTERREKLERQFAAVLSTDHSVLLMPPHATTAPYHTQPLLQPFNFAYAALFNSLGLPVTQVPLGLNHNGLPLGVQVVSALGQDHVTIQVAAQLEKGFGGWTNF